MTDRIESGYGLLYVSQIVKPEVISNVSQASVDRFSKSFSQLGFNLAIPIVCLTQEEGKYQLLTGLSIYEAAQQSGVKQIWVLLIGDKRQNAEKILNEIEFQMSLNERIIDPREMDEFIEFLNDDKSPLTSLSGIKDGYAKLIKENRPFNSIEEMKKRLGAKRCLNWLKAYKSYNS